MLRVWLALIRYVFECGWIRAQAGAIITVIMFIRIIVVLDIIGFGVLNIFL
jgi:hypothetical protein